ncbi:hypothetical protein LCGC14_0225940 [marine sediment metagenome]|uniref:SSD domain-containing protein n=1 Tax=marine sediment metagenome TaxID=412755 RepID=A0A0F9WW74_9ZZZZ|nr:efflux RND transporter permease subunit [Phycisphaerae bacterium]HDZ42953.1 efflux RND transporter permease subunit [Phycisphaerae bacterium]
MSLTSFTLHRRSVVLAMLAVAVAMGVFRFVTMPRRADPSFTIRTAQVITQWPGRDAERVERLVTAPLEKAISTIEDLRIEKFRSTTTRGQSVIYAELSATMSADKISETWEKVRAKVEQARQELPKDIVGPIVNDDFGDPSVMLLAIHEKGRGKMQRYTMRDIEIYADYIYDAISLLPGVFRAEISGVRQEAIYLETTQENWAGVGLTLDELGKLLTARNITASGGSIETDRIRIAVETTGEFDAVSQIESIIVRYDASGAPIYLKDLGITVRRDYQDPPTIMARFGDTEGDIPCVIVSFVMKKTGVKVTDLAEQARQLLHRMQYVDKAIPPDIAIDTVFDESVFVENKISDFMVNVLQAIAIVVAVAILMAGFRSAAVMAAAIPFVMIMSIGIFSFLGVDLEQMSIASLIIALGMLVDNAVVVCDNVRRFLNEGHSRMKAVIEGVRQIQMPTLMGTLTTVFAFLPMAFLISGEKGEYVYSIPTVVSVTLLSSWVLALTITSLMAYWMIRPDPPAGAKKPSLVGKLIRLLRRRKGAPPAEAAKPQTESGTPQAESGLIHAYGKISGVCLGAKPLVLGITAVLLVGACMLPIGSQFFPDDLRDILYIDVWLPEGSSLEMTNRATGQVEDIMRELSPYEDESFSGERLASYYSSVGGSGPRFALGVDPQPAQSNYAQIIVRTTDPTVTDRYVREIRRAAARKIPGARVVPSKLALGPSSDPIGIRVYGTSATDPGFADMAKLRQQADKVKALVLNTPGTWNVHDVWGDPGYRVDVKIDQDRANLAAVSNAGIAESVNAYYSGHHLTVYREGDHKVPVFFRLPPADRGQIHDERTMFVEGTAGKVPLDSVAEMQPKRTIQKIERRQKNRMIETRAEVDDGLLASAVLAGMMPKLNEIEATFPPGYSIEIGGEQEDTVEAQGELVFAFGVGVMLIILVLIYQYNSFIKPFIILATVPMGAIGAFLGLYVTGNALGFMPMLGLVSLAGIVVNTGILYMEFAEEKIRNKLIAGEDLAQQGQKSCNGLTRAAFRGCLVDAGKLRLMPILLTVSTTVGGLIPLALFGGPLWEGMSWMLIFGLIVATALTLLVLPALYASLVEYVGLTLVKLPQQDEE